MLRCSVKAYFKDYITEIGSQIGTDDTSEIVNLIIADHKRFMSGSAPAAPKASLSRVETISTDVTDEDLLSALDGEL